MILVNLNWLNYVYSTIRKWDSQAQIPQILKVLLLNMPRYFKKNTKNFNSKNEDSCMKKKNLELLSLSKNLWINAIKNSNLLSIDFKFGKVEKKKHFSLKNV